MEIRLERRQMPEGFEIGCECGHVFTVPHGVHHAQCARCGKEQDMGNLFDQWWMCEPTLGRYALREA